MLTFQHIGTARHRDSEYKITVRLYGRQADGVSIALTVQDVPAYGYIRCTCDRIFQQRVSTLIQWWLSMKRSEQSTKKYKKENDEEKPVEDIFRQWSTWWYDQCAIGSQDIQWTPCRGYNIRHVYDGQGPEVWCFKVFCGFSVLFCYSSK